MANSNPLTAYDLTMTHEELREASGKLGCLIALERGTPMERVALAYGRPPTEMHNLIHKWRKATASRWPRWTRAAA